MSCGLFQPAFFASVYHARKEFSASACSSQNDFSVFTEITRIAELTLFPIWEQEQIGLEGTNLTAPFLAQSNPTG
jgi:hypothetical protein